MTDIKDKKKIYLFIPAIDSLCESEFIDVLHYRFNQKFNLGRKTFNFEKPEIFVDQNYIGEEFRVSNEALADYYRQLDEAGNDIEKLDAIDRSFMKDKLIWRVSQYYINGLSDDNFVYIQNIHRRDNFRSIIIFIDEEYKYIIDEAIDVARQASKDLRSGKGYKSYNSTDEERDWEGILMASVPEIEVMECDRTSKEYEKNVIKFFYDTYKVQYPNVEWFL